MPRQKKGISEKYNSAFAKCLRNLLDVRKTSQFELSEQIGKSRQVVSQYCNGESEPSFETLVKIAAYFKVSTDYLLGLTEADTDDKDIQFVCDYTGLSKKAVENITNVNKKDENKDSLKEAVNAFLTTESLHELWIVFARYREECGKANKYYAYYAELTHHTVPPQSDDIFPSLDIDDPIKALQLFSSAFLSNEWADYLKFRLDKAFWNFVNDSVNGKTDDTCLTFDDMFSKDESDDDICEDGE